MRSLGELQKFVKKTPDAYYLVYRPKNQGLLENNLPRTGYKSVGSNFAVAGLTLAVLVIARGRMVSDTCLLFCW